MPARAPKLAEDGPTRGSPPVTDRCRRRAIEATTGDDAAEHREVVSKFNEFAGALGQLATIGDEDPTTFDAALQAVYDLGGEIDAVIKRLKDKGYRIPAAVAGEIS